MHTKVGENGIKLYQDAYDCAESSQMAWDDLTWVSQAEVHIGHRRHLETQ